jgi:hypothetical protein
MPFNKNVVPARIDQAGWRNREIADFSMVL